MFSESYRHSIDSMETSSGGSLPTSYETHWAPESFNPRIDEDEVSAALRFVARATVDTSYQEVSFSAEGRREDILKRLIGWALVFRMPEDGLAETLSSLKDIFEFYMERTRYQLPEPPVVRTGNATVVGVSRYPDAVVAD